MSHFAKVENNIVTRVIVADEEFFDTFVDDNAGEWIETKMDGSIRKNYAGLGFSYDATKDSFIPPKQYESWTLNEDSCQWEAPVSYPTDGQSYSWDEDTTAWVENV